MAAAATEMGLLPGTRSSSTAFLAMKVAAICTCLGRPRLEQKRDMKSPVVMRSTLVSRAFRISLKQRPISFLEMRETAQISAGGRGGEDNSSFRTVSQFRSVQFCYVQQSGTVELVDIMTKMSVAYNETIVFITELPNALWQHLTSLKINFCFISLIKRFHCRVTVL